MTAKLRKKSKKRRAQSIVYFDCAKKADITLVDITDSKNTYTRNCGLKTFMWKVDQLNNIPYFSMTDGYLACYRNAGFWYASFYCMMTKFSDDKILCVIFLSDSVRSMRREWGVHFWTVLEMVWWYENYLTVSFNDESIKFGLAFFVSSVVF